jgi:hypothetical protein
MNLEEGKSDRFRNEILRVGSLKFVNKDRRQMITMVWPSKKNESNRGTEKGNRIKI